MRASEKKFRRVTTGTDIISSDQRSSRGAAYEQQKTRFTSANTTLDHQQQQQQQQGVKSHVRAGHDSFEIDTQGVDGISYEDIENERVVAKATRAGMKNWNSKVNTSYSTSLFSEIIDPKLPTNIPAFAFKMSVNDAEREKV